MFQGVNTFRNSVVQGFRECGEGARAFGKQLVTFDRSHQVFGDTPQTQLKGRDRVITRNLVSLALGSLLLVIFLHESLVNPWIINYVMIGVTAMLTLAAIKEIAIQSVARAREKARYQIEHETDLTRFTFIELLEETEQRVF